MSAIVRLTSPEGAQSFLCYDYPGHAPNRHDATQFATDQVAWRAANAALYGNPNAFWESERRSANATRERMRGWVASVEEV